MPDWSLVLAGAGAGLFGLVASVVLRRPRVGFALATIAAALVLVGRDLAEWQVVVGVSAWTVLATVLAIRVRRVGLAGFAVGLAVGGLVWLPVATALPGTAADGLRVATIVGLPVTVVTVWTVARRLGPARTWVIVAGGTVCIYGAVPDTEQISVLAAMVAVTSVPLVVRRLPHLAASVPHSPGQVAGGPAVVGPSVGGPAVVGIAAPDAAPSPSSPAGGAAAERAAQRWGSALDSPLAEVVPLATVRRGRLRAFARIHWEPMTMAVVSVAGLATWAAATGSVGREAAFVAGPGCVLLPVMLAHLGDVVIRRPAHAPWGRGDIVVLGVPLVTAAVLARTAGLADTIDDAVAMAALVVAFGMLATLCSSLCLGRRPGRSVATVGHEAWLPTPPAVEGGGTV